MKKLICATIVAFLFVGCTGWKYGVKADALVNCADEVMEIVGCVSATMEQK